MSSVRSRNSEELSVVPYWGRENNGVHGKKLAPSQEGEQKVMENSCASLLLSLPLRLTLIHEI